MLMKILMIKNLFEILV